MEENIHTHLIKNKLRDSIEALDLSELNNIFEHYEEDIRKNENALILNKLNSLIKTSSSWKEVCSRMKKFLRENQ